jgi:hypothetical protein
VGPAASSAGYRAAIHAGEHRAQHVVTRNNLGECAGGHANVQRAGDPQRQGDVVRCAPRLQMFHAQRQRGGSANHALRSRSSIEADPDSAGIPELSCQVFRFVNSGLEIYCGKQR